MTAAGAARDVDYLLIGGGLASATAAEAIRARDANGGIVIVAAEPQPPYHRPPLSKEYLRGEIAAEGTYGNGGVYVHLPEWYQEQRVELIEGDPAVALDAAAHTVRLASGAMLRYRRLLLATGGRPRALDIPGAGLPGVRYLRTLADADALRADFATPTQDVAVIGSGFIGLEAAAVARFLGQRVALVEPMQRPWQTILSQGLADYLEGQFTRRGVATYYSHVVEAFLANDDGRLAGIRVRNTSDENAEPFELPATLAVVAIGIQLNTELAATAGLDVDPRNGIVTDEHLRASAPDIFVAGDVAAYPDPVAGRMHFEHWDNAIASGQVAGANMAGASETYRHVPYFFSDQFDLSINMVGYPLSTMQIVVRGDPGQDSFTALYVADETLRAALMVNDDAQMDLLRDLIAANTLVHDAALLADPAFDLASLREGATDRT